MCVSVCISIRLRLVTLSSMKFIFIIPALIISLCAQLVLPQAFDLTTLMVILSSRHSPSHSEVKRSSSSNPYPLPYPTSPSYTCPSCPQVPPYLSFSMVTASVPHPRNFSGLMAPLLLLLLVTPLQPHQPLGRASNTFGMLQN